MTTSEGLNVGGVRRSGSGALRGWPAGAIHVAATVFATWRRPCSIAALVSLTALASCASGPLPPVFGAVFGLENAESVRYRSGQIPEPAVEPGDKLLGLAANSPGQCVYRRAGSARRYIATCPEGYDA